MDDEREVTCQGCGGDGCVECGERGFYCTEFEPMTMDDLDEANGDRDFLAGATRVGLGGVAQREQNPSALLRTWGKQEHETRLDDIARVKAGTLSLEAAQAAARMRRRMAGFSPAVCDQALRLARVARS